MTLYIKMEGSGLVFLSKLYLATRTLAKQFLRCVPRCKFGEGYSVEKCSRKEVIA